MSLKQTFASNMNSYIFLCLVSVVCNTVYTSVAYNRLKRNDELTLSEDQMHSQEKDEDIVGGQNAKLGDVPWIVSIVSDILCGGTIINKRTIMTAGHCVKGIKPSKMTVRAGSLHYGKGGSTYKVDRFILHPEYNKPAEYNNDIALLILMKDIAIDNNITAAVKLPANGSSDPAPGLEVQVAGYGKIGDNATLAKSLQIVNTTIFDRTDCKIIYEKIININNHMICAGTKKGGMNACHGDSGGPLLHGKTQLGIVSLGEGCKNGPVVYTRVSKYIDFITENKAKN